MVASNSATTCPFDRQSAAQTSAREVEKLSDHPADTLAAADDARGRLGVLIVEAAAPKQRGGGHDDRPERIAQVVPDDTDEQLPKFGQIAFSVQ
jgi:hypothetical protein